MFGNLTLRGRLLAGFGAMLLLLMVMVGVGQGQMGRLKAGTDAFSTNIVPSLTEQNTMGQALSTFRRYELRHLLTDDAQAMDAVEAEMAKAKARFVEALDRYAQGLLSDERDRALEVQTRQAAMAYFQGWEAMRALSRATAADPTALERAKAQMPARQAVFDQAVAAVEAWWAHNLQLSAQARNEAEATHGQATGIMLALTAAALLTGVAAALVITRSVQRQLGGDPEYAKAVVAEIARGHLDVQVQLRAGDDSSLLAAMRAMRDRLAEVVSQVRSASESIATGSAQIAMGNADLSQRTEEQAGNLQQTASSMEQLADTVRTSAGAASEANGLAGQASGAAAEGGHKVTQVVQTMEDIAESSRRIQDIIGVIDGIAFQTNILALNAAVEAARAGEQGRGFAVVAGEVRTLAGRSADAAREIKSLIGASVEKVDAGTRQVREAGGAMAHIVAQVRSVSERIHQLTEAAADQSSGIGQINDAVTQLDQATQQNAALVEQSAAAAESLRQQAERLTQVVGSFRLRG
ncbi:methyl-accepting chemotaxis protein [Ideonella livida]|uniref:Methyl-accepting chemotaxis protein n=1 Tax=Ideonella livida TaxID=2707176 RepID=A0A7C9PJ53_9BURK|nr:methyl-accepting chemotaxis protein [Ideonella livida]NDY93148.1 methyl-accepting chemotaxis protein [Ideonella livida]